MAKSLMLTLAALNFYGYNHETMCQKHTWEINMLGRRVMPIMHEISHLPGGHKPLNFVHKLADGSTRHVQTYAGPIEIYGDKLMLCIVHDITEQNGWRSSWNMLPTMMR